MNSNEGKAASANFTLFAGSASRDLAGSVARDLEVRLGACAIERFPDGEVSVHLDEPVRGRQVFLIQSTAPPVNENLMELLAFADACRRASARRITAIVPYFGYARSDKRHARREPIAASMVATLMQAVGIHHLVTIDLHAAQIEGFFQIPVDTLTAVPVFCDVLRRRLPPGVLVVSPDEGRVKMATEFAQRLETSVIVLHKQRLGGSHTLVTQVIGDVADRTCLIIDDMITTGGTIAESVAALMKYGARPEVSVAATHGVFVAGAFDRLSHKAIREVFVTDTVAHPHKAWPPLRVISLAPLLAAAIRRLAADHSISDLYRGIIHSPSMAETL
jgi:ribose-phosphate pyrophosphokinase